MSTSPRLEAECAECNSTSPKLLITTVAVAREDLCLDRTRLLVLVIALERVFAGAIFIDSETALFVRINFPSSPPAAETPATSTRIAKSLGEEHISNLRPLFNHPRIIYLYGM